MHIDLSALSLQLPRGAALRIEHARGLRVRGRAGRLWLTEEGSGADVFLHDGEDYVVRGDGRVVIGADLDAAVVLDGAGRRLPQAVRLR